MFSDIRLKGSSMSPVLCDGAVVRFDFHYHRLSVGDIILYLDNQQFFVHRLLKVEADDCFIIDDGGICSSHNIKRRQIFAKACLPFFYIGFSGLLLSFFIRFVRKAKKEIRRQFF